MRVHNNITYLTYNIYAMYIQSVCNREKRTNISNRFVYPSVGPIIVYTYYIH